MPVNHFIMHWLEKLRSKPEPFKNMVVLSSSLTFTAIVAIAWSFSLPDRYQGIVSGVGSVQNKESQGVFTQFLNDTKTQVANVVDSVKDPSFLEDDATSAESLDDDKVSVFSRTGSTSIVDIKTSE